MRKSMVNVLSIIIIVIMASSCSYTNIYEIKPIGTEIKDNNYFEFENDTVKVTYSFWEDKGVMAFTFYNKLNIPVYIDWKKSSVIKNDEKIDYWADETKTKSHSITWYNNSRLFSGGNNLFNYAQSSSESKSIRPERITFISPRSSVTRIQSNLYNITPEKISSSTSGSILSRDGQKNFTVEFVEYTQESSQFIFRNFLTFSTSEKFDKEIYIDNGFYVSRINKIKTKKLEGVAVYNKKKDKIEYVKPITSAKEFYIDMGN